MEQHLRSEYDKTLGPRLERLQKGLHDVNIDTAESAAAVSIAMPSAVAAILSTVGFPIGPSAGRIAGIAFAVWTVLRKRKKAVDSTLKPSPEAYLYRVNQLSRFSMRPLPAPTQMISPGTASRQKLCRFRGQPARAPRGARWRQQRTPAAAGGWQEMTVV